MMRKILPLLLAFLPILCQGQHYPVGSPIISHFEKSDYHAGTQNWSIIEDSRGIMYFGNNKGLLEFDGTTWQVFRLPNHTIVRSIAKDDTGRLYVGGQDEFGYLTSNDKGSITYHSLTHLIPPSYHSFEDIWKIVFTEDNLFFCSQRAIFQLKDEKIQVIEPEHRFENFFFCNEKFYVQDTQKGLLVWQNGQLVPVVQGESFTDVRITAILPFQSSQSLIISAVKGLYIMDETGILPWNVEASDFLDGDQPYTAIQLSDGRYAIGTTTNGLLIIDQKGRLIMNLNKSNGLQNNTILSIFQDQHQNLWLGLDNGIDYVETSAPFSFIHNEVGVEGTGYVSVIHQDKLYLGTNHGLYYINWPQEELPFGSRQFQQISRLKGQVWSLNKLDNDLIVGMHEGAFQIKEDQIIPLANVEGAWKFFQLHQHPDFAIEGTYSGLFLYKRQKNVSSNTSNWTLLHKLEGFNESARVMEQDDEGNIWVSHAYKGLYKIYLDIENQSIRKVAFYNDQNGLPSNININVARIRKELIFTTPQGIYKYDAEADHFVQAEELNQVFGKQSEIHRILEDQSGSIWFSVDQNFGLLKIEEQGVFNDINKIFFNHLQERIKAGFEHVYAHDEHNVFIATEKGFLHYNPSNKKDYQLPFKTLIRKVSSIVQGDSTIYGGNAPGLSPDSLANLRFKFPHNNNDLRFSFSTPFFEQINHIEYRYKLEGFHENWSDWTTQTQKEYTNLSPGDYSFVVEARNAYAQTSTSANFAFVINPPWTETFWAKGLFSVIVLAILAGISFYFQMQSRKKQEQLKQEQTQKLQQQEQEFKKEVEKSEAEIIRLRNEKLVNTINHKNSQLAAATMHLVQKGEMLQKVKQELNKILPNTEADNQKQIKKLIRNIVDDARLDETWEQFEFHFDQVHENFLKRLREKYNMLTPKDQRLCAYLRMNLSTKEIAPLMNISVRGVEISRYRLRKKLNVDSDTNLIEFMMNI